MRKNMLEAIKEAAPSYLNELANANFYQLQNFINIHNAKVRGEAPPPVLQQ